MSMGKKLMSWVDARFPATETYEYHMSKYYAPKNFNFWYFFGVLSMIVLVNQLVTGIWLTMMFNPSAEGAFDSVEYIMRDVEAGWLIRYMHSTGASAFFVVVYLHMFRGLLYGSYQKPRELVCGHSTGEACEESLVEANSLRTQRCVHGNWHYYCDGRVLNPHQSRTAGLDRSLQRSWFGWASLQSVSSPSWRLAMVGWRRSCESSSFFVGAPGRAHSLGGERPLLAR